MSGTLPMNTKMKADKKLTVLMCSQVLDRKSTAPSRGDFRRLQTWTKTPGA